MHRLSPLDVASALTFRRDSAHVTYHPAGAPAPRPSAVVHAFHGHVCYAVFSFVEEPDGGVRVVCQDVGALAPRCTEARALSTVLAFATTAQETAESEGRL